MSVLRQLYQLQEVDREWDDKSARLAEVNDSLGETDELIQAREAVTEIEGEVQQLRGQVRALELDVASVSAKLKQNQERLYGGRVRNPKELSGLQEEAGALRRRRSELEDQELELMIELEEQEAELAERQARLRQIEATWREDQAQLRTEKEQLEVRLAELEEERAEKRAPLGRTELADYDDLRVRGGGLAVARLKGGICQVCGVDVPVSLANAVERGEGIHYCPVCGRLLFGA